MIISSFSLGYLITEQVKVSLFIYCPWYACSAWPLISQKIWKIICRNRSGFLLLNRYLAKLPHRWHFKTSFVRVLLCEGPNKVKLEL